MLANICIIMWWREKPTGNENITLMLIKYTAIWRLNSCTILSLIEPLWIRPVQLCCTKRRQYSVSLCTGTQYWIFECRAYNYYCDCRTRNTNIRCNWLNFSHQIVMNTLTSVMIFLYTISRPYHIQPFWRQQHSKYQHCIYTDEGSGEIQIT